MIDIEARKMRREDLSLDCGLNHLTVLQQDRMEGEVRSWAVFRKLHSSHTDVSLATPTAFVH